MHWAKFNARGWELKHTPKDACLQSWASDLHFHWELRVFADPLPFPLQLLDPKVMVIDSRATCLKVRGRSDRRGKLPAWPSDATAMIRQIRHEIRHIDIICAAGMSHWPIGHVFLGFRVPSATPKQGRTFAER